MKGKVIGEKSRTFSVGSPVKATPRKGPIKKSIYSVNHFRRSSSSGVEYTAEWKIKNVLNLNAHDRWGTFTDYLELTNLMVVLEFKS